MKKCIFIFFNSFNLPEEYKISLVVEGDHAPAVELRIVVEEGGEHSRDAVTQSSAEVVQKNFRSMRRELCRLLDVLHMLHRRKLVVRCRTLRQMDDQQATRCSTVLVHHCNYQKPHTTHARS